MDEDPSYAHTHAAPLGHNHNSWEMTTGEKSGEDFKSSSSPTGSAHGGLRA